MFPHIQKFRKLRDQSFQKSISIYDSKESLKKLNSSLTNQLENKDANLRVANDDYKIIENDDYAFLVMKDLALRTENIETLKKTITSIKNVSFKE